MELKPMKIEFIFTTLLLFVFALTIPAQEKKTEKPNPPKEKRMILSFANPEQMFQILDGRWSYLNISCENPMTIKVPADRKTIKILYPKSDKEDVKEYIFVVAETGRYYLRGQYQGEQRKDDNGKLQVWDFMFLSKDEFVWHRADWKGLRATPPVIRCKEDKQIAFTK
jgi:hypothetical protein